jgi:hypothetical protein
MFESGLDLADVETSDETFIVSRERESALVLSRCQIQHATNLLAHDNFSHVCTLDGRLGRQAVFEQRATRFQHPPHFAQRGERVGNRHANRAANDLNVDATRSLKDKGGRTKRDTNGLSIWESHGGASMAATATDFEVTRDGNTQRATVRFQPRESLISKILQRFNVKVEANFKDLFPR